VCIEDIASMNYWTESEEKTKQTNMPRAEVLSLVTLKYHLREASMTRITNENVFTYGSVLNGY
jgi:hypothetical protein